MSDGFLYFDLNGLVLLFFLCFNFFEGGFVGMVDFYFDCFGIGVFFWLFLFDLVKVILLMMLGVYVCNNVL